MRTCCFLGSYFLICGGSIDGIPSADCFSVNERGITKFKESLPEALMRHCIVEVKEKKRLLLFGGTTRERKASRNVRMMIAELDFC